MKKTVFAAFALLSGLVLADPAFSVTSTRALWPFSKRVEVKYILTGASSPIDVLVHVKADGALEFDVPDGALGGECRSVTSGEHTLTFDPSRVPVAAEKGVLTGLQVTLSAGVEKLYMLVDLAAGLGNTAARISYTNEVVGANGQWDDYYRTNAIALRRIKAGTFTMGWDSSANSAEKPAHAVTLTHDFYIGVFELTQGQVKRFFYQWPLGGSDPLFTNAADYDRRPATQIRYYSMRGTAWQPTNSLEVALDVERGSPTFNASRSLYHLRNLTGNAVPFDLPTEAQWEYACRAGTTTELYDGNGISTTADSDANLDRLGRYKYNGGYVKDGNSYVKPDLTVSAAEGGTAIVGSYAPNAWGLYDMLGNVEEWCLDGCDENYYTASPVVDPMGGINYSPSNNVFYRVCKGGSWQSPAKNCRASYRVSYYHSAKGEMGCRICVTLR